MHGVQRFGLVDALLVALLLAVATNAEKDCDCNKPTPTCEMNCSMIVQPPIDLRRTCRWIVKDQLFKAIAPSIFQMNVGESCDRIDYFADYMYLCEDCSRTHQPCNNSHAACGGCSCWEPTYDWDHGKSFVEFMEDLGRINMTTHLTCPYIKQAYMYPNYNVVECEEEEKIPQRQGNISAIREDVEDGWNASTLASGVIHGGCTLYPEKLGCEKVPLILKFECDDCRSQGSAKMLTTCCRECKKFVDGLSKNPLIPDTILPIGFCSGCDSKYYTFEDSPMPDWEPARWRDYKEFAEYTEEKALEKFEKHIDNSVCRHLTPHCGVADRHENGSYAEECHDGCCPSDPGACDADGCWRERSRSVAEELRCEETPSGRRLEFLEPISEEKNETKSIQAPLFHQCNSNVEAKHTFDAPSEPRLDELKAVIKTTMALPGTVETYQTDEAKTALRHGFAKTLQEVVESWITVSVTAADGGRRLSAVSVEFTINVPSDSSVAVAEITESVKSVAVDNDALATNLRESFDVHAQAVDVSTVDFNKATVSEPEIELLVTEKSTSSTTRGSKDDPFNTVSTSGKPDIELESTDFATPRSIAVAFGTCLWWLLW